MNPLLHALNTGTLAAWLSVAAAGVTGFLLPDRVYCVSEPAEEITTVIWKEPEIMLDPEDEAPAETAPEEMPATEPETLPAPPEMPELANLEPLPEIPDLPPPPEPVARTAPPENKPSPSAIRVPARPTPPRAATAGDRASTPAAGSPGTGASSASRLAAGRMPAPAYPSESRRKGQTGTVVVEFTIDTTGRVISAFAKSPSPWPLLNEEAVRTVRRWRFPPGPVMKLQRPIIFQLR
ncbi:MAG: energy transducer TonB [Verrucomicrobia bacterium]|nr:energy transducer TonB [Verrucomicrobiota bacterium]